MPFSPDDIRRKIAPTIPGVSADYRMPAATPDVVMARVTDQLDSTAIAMQSIISQGRWSAPGACAFQGVGYYDHACTPANIFKYIWRPDFYQRAQIKLADALSINPVPRELRVRWCFDVMRWIAIAHASTGIPSKFLYSAEPVTTRGKTLVLYGPPRARDIIAGLWSTSMANGLELLFPIGIGTMFEMEDTHQVVPPWHFQATLGREHGDSNRSTVGPGLGPVPGMSPTPLLLLDYAMSLEGNALVPTPANVADLLHRGTTEGKRNNARGRFMPSADPVIAYLRAWAEPIVSTSQAMFVTGDAWTRYKDYLLDPRFEGRIGLTRAEIRALDDEINRERARSMVRASVGTSAGVAGALSEGAGALLLGVTAGIMSILAEVLPLASGCHGYPQPFLYRSLTDPECDILAEDATVQENVRHLIEMGRRVDYTFSDPWAGAEQPPFVVDPVIDTSLALKLLAGAAGAAAGLVGATWLKNR